MVKTLKCSNARDKSIRCTLYSSVGRTGQFSPADQASKKLRIDQVQSCRLARAGSTHLRRHISKNKFKSVIKLEVVKCS